MSHPKDPPGAPGTKPLWAHAAKTGVGTALSPVSDVWFTLSHGILTEVFHPFVDTACTRDLEFLVTDRREFFSEEKWNTRSEVSYLSKGVPAYRVINTCKQGRYRIEKLVLTDPYRSTVLQQIQFTALKGKTSDYALYVLLSPHLGNQGAGNSAWTGDFKGDPMLFARRDDLALALACSAPWKKRSVGYVGTSDGWQDVCRHKEMQWSYERAEHGNVALTGEIDVEACGGKFVLALSFGRDEGAAGYRARASLLEGFEAARKTYVQGWTDWHKELLPLEGSKQHPQDLYHISAAVMRIHEAKHFQGGIIASLATPWGFSKGDNDLGYHLVWPRDMIETVGALLAAKKHEDARRVLAHFQVTQEADGHWPQNMFTSGMPFWDGIQLDETAFVIQLVDLARREGAIQEKELASLWPMVGRAAGYLVRHGPVTPMDRWEEEAGYFPSTMAVEIAALLTAAELAEQQGEPELSSYLRETADAWNAAIERLVYATGTELAREAGVEGYYVRFARPDQREAASPAAGSVTLKNHKDGKGHIPVAEIASPDALCLVRFGLRAADDPRIVNTVKAIDKHLKVDTPHGPAWHRYSDDGYGEHADGAPFDGTGIGRCWPLLTGERAHYELAAGRRDEAEQLVRAMEAFANESGLLPEQVWDCADIPERELYFGRPSGSAMPLVWAHAEYVKLRRSLHDGRVFDMPPQTVQRYLVEKTGSPHVFWRLQQRCRRMPAGKTLRVELLAPALVHWSSDGWRTSQDSQTRDTGLGIHLVDLPTANLSAGKGVVFTFFWTEDKRWEGQDFAVTLEQGQSHEGKEGRPSESHVQSTQAAVHGDGAAQARGPHKHRRHGREAKHGT